MTCVVGLVDGGHVFIAADSAGVDDDGTMVLSCDPKVFRVGLFVIGYTTSFRMGQLLAYRLKPPAMPTESHNLFGYMATLFVDDMRRAFREGGVLKVEHGVESAGRFLVGCEGRLFVVDSNFQVIEDTRGYGAIGSGQNYALGSLHSTQRTMSNPNDRLMAALDAAEAHNANVRRPFIVEKV